MWWFLSCQTSDSALDLSSVSEVEVQVLFSGTPKLEQPNGDVFVLDYAAASLYSIRFPECELSKGLYTPLINQAYAGHSEIAIPSNWNHPLFIDILNPTDVYLEYSIPAQSICEAAVTWARWDGGTFDIPNPPPENTFTIQLIGQCTNLNGEVFDYDFMTSVPSERIDGPPEFKVDEEYNRLIFTLEFDSTNLLLNIGCDEESIQNSSRSALQGLTNLQTHALWTWEWK